MPDVLLHVTSLGEPRPPATVVKMINRPLPIKVDRSGEKHLLRSKIWIHWLQNLGRNTFAPKYYPDANQQQKKEAMDWLRLTR